jgi:hypothetical protein
MGFVKRGDSMPVIDYIDTDGEKMLCPNCSAPFVTVAVLENDELKLVCKCENSDVE